MLTIVDASKRTRLGSAAHLRENFVREYLVDFNAAAAYKRASGRKSRGARQSAHRLLQRADVRQMLSKAHAEKLSRIEITQERVVHELAQLGIVRTDVDLRVKLEALKELYRHTAPTAAGPGVMASMTVDASKLATMTDEELERGIANADKLLEALAKDGDGRGSQPRPAPRRALA